jgi:tetratricopeptide (TPR) repeat protein
MLDTTRAYSMEKLIESGEHGEIGRRHADFYFCILEGEMYSREKVALSEFSDRYTDQLSNIRNALAWVFENDPDAMIKTRMSVAVATLYISLSLLSECYSVAMRALDLLPQLSGSETLEMYLQTLLGQSLMFIKGNIESSRDALLRGLALAQQLKHSEQELQLLGCLHLFHERMGDYNKAHEYALQGEAITKYLGDPELIVAAHSLLGISCHLLGDQLQSRIHLYKVLLYPQPAKTQSSIRFGFDQYLRARIALARTLWIMGSPDQAVIEARRALEEARSLGHPVTTCMVLIWSISLYLWIGALPAAKDCLASFIDLAEAFSLTPYISVAHGIEGQIAVKSGRPDIGIPFLQGAMQALRSTRYELVTTDFLISQVEGFVLLGNISAAMRILDETIVSVESGGNHLYKPELLRIKGELILILKPDQYSEAEKYFLESSNTARAQSARSFELRTAISRLKFCSIDSRSDRLLELADVFGEFKEGLTTHDLLAAQQLLA